ncbi:MAG TPA: oxaloacetate decarboxylase [Kofleriaceae bacterium]|nr:oxaloacetate decarboxylase [Kofleriaceae bacterium]
MASSINGMAERFRDLLASPAGIEVPGCYDVLSAIHLEIAGFPAVFLSGYGFAASFFGNPDIGLTTLTETTLYARNLTNALRVPLVVDADNGYGNEDNAIRTVHELEHAGAAAMILEDQVFPKRCGHTEGKKVLPLAEYMRKLESALKARRTPLVIVARTDAASIDEGIQRAQTFHAAGADVTLIDGLRSLDDARRVAQEVPGHKQINLFHGGKTPVLPAAELHAMGFKVVLYSAPALFLASAALIQGLKTLRATGHLGSIADQSMRFSEFQDFIESRYLQAIGTPPAKV